jgi:hypothetical protein
LRTSNGFPKRFAGRLGAFKQTTQKFHRVNNG